MKNYLKSFFAVVLFLCMQALAGFIAVICKFIANIDTLDVNDVEAFVDNVNMTADELAVVLLGSGLATILFMYLFRMADRKTVLNFGSIEWKWASVAFVAAVCGIFSTDLISEILNLPNSLEKEFLALSHSFWGVIAVGIVGPVAEEVVFREGVCGNMLRAGCRVPIAVLVSSLCFGLIHINLAQIPFAFVVGIILAIIYVKTGNIVLTSIIHIVNNSVAVIQMNILGEEAAEYSMLDNLGGMGIPYIIMLTIGCVWLLKEFWHRYRPKSQEVVEADESL